MVKTVILPRAIRKRLISTLRCSHAVDSGESQNFSIKSSKEFASRSINVFGELEILEKNHEMWVSENDTHECFEELVNDAEMLPKPESFKKPTVVPRLKRSSSTVFKRRSKKWTYYSLADVPVTSDATNASVALQFLNELRKRHENNKDYEFSQNEGKLMFSKPKEKCRKHNCVVHCSKSAISGSENFPNLTISTGERASEQQEIDKVSSVYVKLDHLQDDFSDSC